MYEYDKNTFRKVFLVLIAFQLCGNFHRAGSLIIPNIFYHNGHNNRNLNFNQDGKKMSFPIQRCFFRTSFMLHFNRDHSFTFTR